MFFCKISTHDYKNLCLLNTFGIEERHMKDDEGVYDDFKEHLDHDSVGWYKGILLWKKKYPLLSINL